MFFRLILRNGMGLTLLGGILGFAGALRLARVLQNQLYQVGTTDPICRSSTAAWSGRLFRLSDSRSACNQGGSMVALRYE
jgi:hypothetical protein